MTEAPYDAFAGLYDFLQQDVSYPKWADYIEKLIDKHGSGGAEPLRFCDLGCGTGSLAVELSLRGHAVVGVDNSPCMLNVAVEKASASEVSPVFLCRDIRGFCLPGKADVVLCLLDTVNHLTGTKDLLRLFQGVGKSLSTGGLFIFDVISTYYMEEVLGDKVFFTTDEDMSLFWNNSFDAKRKINRAELTIFQRDENSSLFHRDEVTVKEKAYSTEEINAAANLCGFLCVGEYASLWMKKPGDKEERIFYVFQKQ